MQIIRLDSDSREWRDFLGKNEALIFHTPEFKELIEKTFTNAKAEYMAIIGKKEIETIFPFLYIAKPMLGKKLISCGYIEYGGPAGLQKDEYIKEILNHLKGKYSKKAEYLEIREGLNKIDFKKLNLKKVSEYRRPLTRLGNIEELWKNISKKRRNNIRKARKSGVVIRELRKEDTESIYKLYLENMKRFGTPPLPKKFFENLFDILAEKGFARVTGAFYKNKLATVMINYIFKKTIHVIIVVSDQEYWIYKPADLIYWESIEWGCKNGYEIFDFGRTRLDSGQFKFKQQLSTEIKDLDYYYLLWNTREIPNFDPTNPKYNLFIKLWQKTPLFIAKRIGPWLREGLGI